jgi:hypothetical protein
MAIPQDQVERMRAAARFHLQIQLIERPGKHLATGRAAVRGRVVRVFRGHDSIRAGDELTFHLNVCASGDAPPPGSAHASYDALIHATCMELFLNGALPDCEVVPDGWALLSESPEKPVMRDGSDVVAVGGGTRRWWQFWG